MLLTRRETTEKLEVIDERGIPMGSVTRPSDPRLFGSEKERFTWIAPCPTSRSPPTPPTPPKAAPVFPEGSRA
jgi:hypothetical protein